MIWSTPVPEVRAEHFARILWVLRDGPIEDLQSGRSVARLQELIIARGGPEIAILTLSGMLKDLEREHALIKRELNGKRTKRIELAIDPETPEFPPDPFQRTSKSKVTKETKGTATKSTKSTKKAPKAASVDDDPFKPLRALLDDAYQRAETVKTEPISLAAVPVLPQAQVPAQVEQHSVHDLLLFAVGAINDAIVQMTVQPAVDLEAMFVGRVTAFDRLMEQNAELTRDLEKAREDVRTLSRANQQLQMMLQSHSR
jgi:hypothetical protein